MPHRSRKNVSLTALIDVVFILLMFFMLTSTFNPITSMALSSSQEDTSDSNSEPQLILVYANGDLKLLTERLQRTSEAALISQLNPEHAVVISAEETATLQQIVRVSSLLNHGGVDFTIGQPFGAPL